MENFEQKPKEEKADIYSEKIEEIALRASGMKEFQNAVAQSRSKAEAIKVVGELLRDHFPEINEIPDEGMIAKNIVDLLYWE